MSDQTFHVLAFVAGIFIQVMIAAFVYGKLTQTVSSTAKGVESERIDRKEEVVRIDREQDQQWTKINANEVQVAKIKGHLKMNGF